MAQLLTRGIFPSVPFVFQCWWRYVRISSGFAASASAPAAVSSASPRKPQRTPRAGRPALCPVRMSTSLSPTKRVLSGVCAEVCHQRVDTSRVGLGGHTGAAAPHQRKAVRAEVVLDDLSTKSVRFVGKDGGLDALGLQRGQQFRDAGVGGGLILLVGVVPGRELGQRRGQLLRRPGVSGGKALHQLRDAVADEMLVGLHWKGGPAVLGADPVGGVGEVVDGV